MGVIVYAFKWTISFFFFLNRNALYMCDSVSIKKKCNLIGNDFFNKIKAPTKSCVFSGNVRYGNGRTE